MKGVYIFFLISCTYFVQYVKADIDLDSLFPLFKDLEPSGSQIEVNDRAKEVNLKVYYECLCPGCIDLETNEMKDIVNKLGPYIDINTYPYGNARTIDINGIIIVCQHGEPECFGNKIHACALKHITNHTEALLYNICLMEQNGDSDGSDTAAANRCGQQMNKDSETILKCANGAEGFKLLQYYGEESKKAGFHTVPHVLINGKEWAGDNSLMTDVCAAFENKPEPCQQ